jgi:hypothetical protein
MSANTKTYLVMIASPSDLSEERQAVTEAIHEWNAQHAVAESTVLLPVKWETHAKPESGVRPQESINRQLVRSCDVLIGMFWTKLGTSTGVAESGTAEEINKFVAAGKPAMLYFSNRPVDPNKINLKQLERLKKFKDATYKKALIGSFSDVDGLRRTVLKDLVRQVIDLRSRARSVGRVKLDEASQLTDLILVHRRHKITPEQFELYRKLLEPRRRAGKSGPKTPNPITGLFFDDGAAVSATIDKDEPKQGWSCTIDFAGDNYETKKFEVFGVVLNRGFRTAKSAILHGKRLVRGFGVECLDTRTQEL